jgi:hypothetical protein
MPNPDGMKVFMSLHIEDYALIGDCQTAALVGRDGSIDWLCLPRFDSSACFAALLGEPKNGRWQIVPTIPIRSARRQYLDDSLVLETVFETDAGTVAVIDFMPVRDTVPELMRIVEGRGGQVPLRMELILRFDFGSVVPWMRKAEGGIEAIAGPDAIRIRSSVPLRGENLTTVADFTVSKGEIGGTGSGVDGNPRLVEGMVRPLQIPGGISQTGAAIPNHAQGDDLHAERRHRGRDDHVAAGEDRRRPQLGLPLLLAARCDPQLACLAELRLHR